MATIITKTDAWKSGDAGKKALKKGTVEMFKYLCRDKSQSEAEPEQRSNHYKPTFKAFPLCHDFK